LERDGRAILKAGTEAPLRAVDGDELRHALIDSALTLLAEGGRGEFSLRKVAERVGASGSAASHRFGDRAGLVAETANVALQQEEADLARFARWIPPLDPEVEAIAPVLVEWLDQRTRWSRTQARISCELILMSYREPRVFRYGADLHALYIDFLGRLCSPLTDAARDLLALFLIAESPNWLVLADDAQFKLLSQETARRAVAIALGRTGDTPAFWVAWNAQHSRAAPTRMSASTLSGTKARIAAAVAQMIAHEGAHAVTHRAIAKAASVSLSSLVHHFGKRGDLIRTGVQVLFDAHAGTTEASTVTSSSASVAAFELAMYALTDPFLAPLTAEVRRRQGTRSATSGLAPGVREVIELVTCALHLLDAPETSGARVLCELAARSRVS
jgi:AcrR family transcriptional regulator